MADYCLKEYIGEWNGVHYYYALNSAACSNSPVVLMLQDRYSGTLPMPCPCDGIAIPAVEIETPTPRTTLLQVVCEEELNDEGMQDFVYPRKGKPPGGSPVKRGRFKIRTGLPLSITSDTAPSSAGCRLLEFSGEFPAGTAVTFKIGQELRDRNSPNLGHFRTVKVSAKVYYVVDAGVT
jgi:hypothetical protein